MSPRIPKPRRPRWKRRPDARPEEIIEAAIEVFGEQGFARARLDDVARRAGVSKGTLYLYFDSKEALFRAMVRGRAAAAVATGAEFTRAFQGTSADLLRELLQRFWDTLSQNDLCLLTHVMQYELDHFPELSRFYMDEVIVPARELVRGVIERGIAAGEFRPVSPELLSRILPPLLVQLTRSQRMFRRLDPTVPPDAALFDSVIDLTLRGVLAPPR